MISSVFTPSLGTAMRSIGAGRPETTLSTLLMLGARRSPAAIFRTPFGESVGRRRDGRRAIRRPGSSRWRPHEPEFRFWEIGIGRPPLAKPDASRLPVPNRRSRRPCRCSNVNCCGPPRIPEPVALTESAEIATSSRRPNSESAVLESPTVPISFCGRAATSGGLPGRRVGCGACSFPGRISRL